MVDRVRQKATLDDVKGVGFKRDGKLIFTRARLGASYRIATQAYHLADFDAYERICGAAGP